VTCPAASLELAQRQSLTTIPIVRLIPIPGSWPSAC